MNLISNWGKKLSDYFSPQQRKLKKLQKQHQADKRLVSSLNKSKWPNWAQFRLLPKVLTKTEKKIVKILSSAIFLALIALFTNIYFQQTVAVPMVGGIYTEGLIGAPRFINPILAPTNDADTDLSSLIFSGLLKYDKNNQLAPDLAISLPIMSADQLTYTFNLKPNVQWQDGQPLTADDIIYTIASIQDLEFKSPLWRSFQNIIAEKIDDQTLTFTLKEPYAPFLDLMTVGILPQHLWSDIPAGTADLAELNKRPVGTGPWKFDSFKKDKIGNIKSYTLAVNESYYGDKPYLSKLVFKFYGDFISAVEGLKNKEVEGIASLPKELRDSLKKYNNINYHELDLSQYTAIFFNPKKNELLSSEYIRQALAMALDKQSIANDPNNFGSHVIDAPILPNIKTSPDIQKYGYNQQEAINLLEKNNWKLISSTTADGTTIQYRKKGQYDLSITITTVDKPENNKVVGLIKTAWEKIGFKVTINTIDKNRIRQDVINSRDYEALLFGENLGSDPDPYPFWHSSQVDPPGLNLAMYASKDVDKLIGDARKTADWQERQTKYWSFQTQITKDLPAIFLYAPTYTYPQDEQVKGFNVINITQPSDRFNNLSDWYIKTKRVWK